MQLINIFSTLSHSPASSEPSRDSPAIITPSPRASPISRRMAVKLRRPQLQDTMFMDTLSPANIAALPSRTGNIDMQLKELYSSLASPTPTPSSASAPTPAPSPASAPDMAPATAPPPTTSVKGATRRSKSRPSLLGAPPSCSGSSPSSDVSSRSSALPPRTPANTSRYPRPRHSTPRVKPLGKKDITVPLPPDFQPFIPPPNIRTQRQGPVRPTFLPSRDPRRAAKG